MKLISCHIDAFGKLKNLDIDFDNGNFKELYAENGWGKSTFAGFIKAMFFGLSVKRGRELQENERARYLPWDDSVCGGSVVFTANKKRYRLNRTFGSKAAADTFMLYDADTNLPSGDFSDDIGEKLFMIDKESFIRTIYVDHNEVNSVSSTNSINAKIGGISNVENDLKNLDNALEKCKAYLNANAVGKKTGALYKIKEEISILKNTVSEKASIDKAIADRLSEKEEIRKELKGLSERQKEITEEKKKLADRKQLLEQADRYREHKKNEEKAKKDVLTVRAYFEGEPATEDEIGRMREANEELKNVLGKLNEAKSRKTLIDPLEEEKYKAETERLRQSIIQSEQSLKDAELGLGEIKHKRDEAFEKLSGLKTEIAKIESTIESNKGQRAILEDNVRNEELKAEKARARCKEAGQKYEALLEKNEELKKQELQRSREAAEKEREKNKKITMLIAVSGILILSGIFLFIAGISAVAAALTAAGAIGLILGIFMKINAGKNVLPEVRNNSLEEEIQRAGRDAEENEREAGEQADAVLRARKKLSDFEASCSGEGRVLSNKKEAADVMASDYEGFKNDYEKRRKALEGLGNELAANRQKLESEVENHRKKEVDAAANETARLRDVNTYSRQADEIFGRVMKAVNDCVKEKVNLPFDENAPAVIDSRILEIMTKARACENLQALYKEAAEKAAAFAEKNPAAAELYPEDNEKAAKERLDCESGDGLDAELDGIAKRTDELNEKLRLTLTSFDSAAQTRDNITEAEARLAILKDELNEGKRKLAIVEKTRDMLEKSRAGFVAKHMSPVKKSFDKYYEMLTGKKQTLMDLNANMELVLTVNSREKKLEALSTGYRDLIGLCYRMALVDEMYKNEKPFIVLDDPLSNIDDEKTGYGIEFIKKLSDEYQLIYLTCNKSRLVSGQAALTD